jgi:hypothetical protein
LGAPSYYAGRVVYPAAGNPVVAVHVERSGDHYNLHVRRSDGELSVVHGATVTGGLRHPGDVLVHLLAHGVPMEDAAHCIEELEPDFDAWMELYRRSETDMAAWRMADHLQREQLKAQFRHDRGN